MAWLPGEAGAVVVPFQPGQEMRLVLPPATALHGRVTVSGRSVLGLPSQFRVRAAYQGKGGLNEALTVEAAAQADGTQADGTWTLAGLTPGTYQVQAAWDNIWLSQTQTLTVGAAALPDMTSNIAPPGLPVLLTFIDRQGRPLRDQAVEIVRPDGPLTGEIWPGVMTADASGRLRVDGLEAGPHFVKLSGQTAAKAISFDVPAWVPAASPSEQKVVLPVL